MRNVRTEARAWLIAPLGAGERRPVARIERRDAGGGSGDCAVVVGLCARWVRDAGWLNLNMLRTGTRRHLQPVRITVARFRYI